MKKGTASSKDKDRMLICLSFEVKKVLKFENAKQKLFLQGWTKHPDLPKGWRFKRGLSTEGKPKGKFVMAPDGTNLDR